MTSFLLDTHAVLWFWWDDPRLSATARSLICDPDNRKFVSLATPWETAIKVSLKKLDIGGSIDGFFEEQMVRAYFDWLPIMTRHLSGLVDLPFHHRDPFDRLLISQAITESLPIISSDEVFDAYGIERAW